VPALDERALALTATFEGHGFELAQGNFDGAGITWGIIGFTLKHGEVGKIVREMQAARPDLVKLAFGDLTPELIRLIDLPLKQQVAFADSVSIPPSKARLAEPWRSCFRVFGLMPEVQEAQLRHAHEHYFQPAQATAHHAQREAGRRQSNGRNELFHKPEDYSAFERIMISAMHRAPTRLLAYCLMPNHWHMVLWPRKDDGMS
jgi:hypothetical protein